MELSRDLIIDVALNAAGYIAAAALVLTMLSLFRRRDGAAVTSRAQTAAGAAGSSAPAPLKPAGDGSRIEFLRLTGKPQDGIGEQKTETEVKPDGGRRDRSEIIRVAREMLKAGATADKITSILPISQAELAVLSAGRR